MSRNRPVRYCRCGVRLARDNPDTRCGPCRAKARDEALCPPQVPAEFWETEQMRDALASWHMGQICFAYRHHRFTALIRCRKSWSRDGSAPPKRD